MSDRVRSDIVKLNHHSLRVIRERSGLTQTQVAADAGIDRPNYAHIEAGRRPGTPAQVVAIAKALKVTPLAIAAINDDEVAA